MAELIPPRRGEFLTKEGFPTTRFAEYLERLTGQTNNNTAASAVTNNQSALSLHFSLENRLGSGDFLTSDETGFTVDSDRLSVDMDEA